MVSPVLGTSSGFSGWSFLIYRVYVTPVWNGTGNLTLSLVRSVLAFTLYNLESMV